MEHSLKEKTVKGVLWSSIDRFSTQGISFIFSILIARLLLPSDYGVIAMLGIFMAVSQCFIDSGFGTVLVRKLDRTETDFSTVFYFNIVVALFFYGLLWLASPYIADFYDLPLLEDVTKIVGLNLIVGTLVAIQGTKRSIAIDFKRFVPRSTYYHFNILERWCLNPSPTDEIGCFQPIYIRFCY